MNVSQVRDESAVVSSLDAFRAARDAAEREAQQLHDEATVLRIEANARDEQAKHVLGELKEGGQRASSLGEALFGPSVS